jgi:hypothetical protein
MRKFKRNNRRQQKQPPKRTLTLVVEALEPRLVLSAAGFGFDGPRGQFDLHQRDHGNGDVYRSAFTDQNHDERSQRQFDSSLRYSHPGDGRLGDPFSEYLVERGRHGGRLDDRPEPFQFFGKAEGESPSSAYSFVDDSPAPATHAAATIPTMTLIVVSLTPTAPAMRGGDLLTFGQLAGRPSQPPQTSPVRTDSQPDRAAATLPVVALISSPASSRAPSITFGYEPASIRSEAAPSGSDTLSDQTMSDSARSTVPGLTTLVSLTTNDLASSWNADGKSFETVFEATKRLDDSVRSTAANEREVAASRDSTPDQALRLSEDLLWAGVSDGGFIDIDTEAANNSRERFDFAEDSKDLSLSKRLSKQMRQDEFWFDFANTRFDLLFDATDMQTLADDHSSDGADEEAWLREDGGMIVLTSSQFNAQITEAVIDAATQSPASETTSREIDIPMDAGIGVFQAIEVATTPVEQRGDSHRTDGSSKPIEGEATAGTEVVAPPVEQAAKNSEGDQPEPIRAAAMPLLLAISAFLQRGRDNRKKITDRQLEV